MFRNKFISSMLAMALLFGQAYAQTENPGQKQGPSDNEYQLSLDDVKKMALERNKTLMNASLDVKKAEAQRWKAIATMLPQVNSSFDYTNMMGYEMKFGPSPIAMPPSGQIGITASIGVSGAQILSTEIGKISMRMADISKAKSEQEIVDQVRVLYYSALVSEETVVLLERNLESIRKLYGFAKRSADVGVTEQVDADQILVQVATMETSLNSTKRAKEMVYNSIRLFLDLDVNSVIKLTQGLEELLNVDTAMSLVTQEFDLNRNYGFQLLQKTTEMSKKQVDLAAWAYGPQLSAFYQYTAKKYFSDRMTLNMTPPNMIGVKLTIPIFSSGSRYVGVRSAKLDYKKNLNTLEETENSLKIQHRQLIYNLKSAYERYETQKKNVEVTERVFDNMGKKYEFGTSSSMDLTTSGTNLISAQMSYVQSLLDFVNAQVSLEQLLNNK